MKNLKRLSLSILVIVMVLFLALPVFADSWKYYFPITIKDTSGTARTYYPVLTNVQGTALNSASYINATGTDTRMKLHSAGTLADTDEPYMMGNVQIPVVIPSLSSNGQVQYDLYTGFSPVIGGVGAPASFDIITGDGGYVTVADAAALELGTDGITEYDGYVDTSASNVGNDIIHKMLAYRVFVQAASTIRASILGAAAPADETLRPDAAGDETNIASVQPGGSNHFTVEGDNNDATYVYTNNAAYERDLYGVINYSVGSGVINSVTIYYRIQSSDANFINGKGAMKTHGVVYETAPTSQNNAWSSKSQVYATNPNTGDEWTWNEINDLQIGVALNNGGAGAGTFARCADVWILVNYTAETVVASATVTPVVSGEHNIEVTISAGGGGTITLDVDGTTDVTVAGAGVPNVTNNWILMSDATPYCNYYKHTVGGTLIAWYQPVAMLYGTNYSTGTVTVTNGDATVEGAGGMVWASTMVGALFKSADGVYYTIASVTDADTLELSVVYGGGTLAGQNYDMYPRLVDREGASQDGAITWGSNTSITITYGTMVSYDSTTYDSSASAAQGYQLPTVPMPANWYGGGYSSGTVTVTNGNANVVGAGTYWSDTMEGRRFRSTDGTWYTIQTVTDTTHMTLTAVYGGGTLAGQTYLISNLPNLPLFGVFESVTATSGIPTNTQYFLLMIMVALILFIFAVIKTRSIMMGGAVFVVILAMAAGTGVIPGWLPYVIGGGTMGILFLARQVG